jgi:hypothetical protein
VGGDYLDDGALETMNDKPVICQNSPHHMMRFLWFLFLWPYMISGIGLLVGGLFLAALISITILCSAISSVLPGYRESAASQEIQRWSQEHPFVEPAPTPEVRRAMRIGRGIHGQVVPLPPTLPNGDFDLNAGM